MRATLLESWWPRLSTFRLIAEAHGLDAVGRTVAYDGRERCLGDYDRCKVEHPSVRLRRRLVVTAACINDGPSEWRP